MSVSVGNISFTNPSFKGVVKVAGVFLDGNEIPIVNGRNVDAETKKRNETLVDKATKDIKAVLMKKADKPAEWKNFDVFRKIYHFFDRDYIIRNNPPENDGRDIFTKVRTSTGDVFLVSGADAADIACSGKNIGSKRKLERNYPNENSYGAEEIARSNYGNEINAVANKYRKNPTEPSIYIYLRTIKKGKKEKIILSSAKMENINHNEYLNPSGWTQPIYFDRQMIFGKKPEHTTTIIISTKTTQTPSTKSENTPTIKKQDEQNSQKKKEENPILEELSHKSWDTTLLKPKKRKKRIPKKYRDLPGQQVFDLK